MTNSEREQLAEILTRLEDAAHEEDQDGII